MPKPKLIELADPVRRLLEERFRGKPAQLREALSSLLVAVIAAEPVDDLDALAFEVRGLKGRLDQLMRYLRTGSRLPEALCAHYEYGQSQAAARKEWGVGEEEWRYIHDLARDTGAHLDLTYLTHDFSFYDWHGDLEQRFVSVDVFMDRRALEDLLIAAVEAYLSPRKGKRKGYEVVGICLGMTSSELREVRGQGMRTLTRVQILRCQPQLSAEGGTTWVEWSDKSLDALLSAASTLFPAYKLVGDFHSHPYDTISQAGEKGSNYSSGDEEALRAWFARMDGIGQRPVVSLVAAIARSDKPVELNHFKGDPATLQMTVGRCRVVVRAHRILGAGLPSTENVRLRVAGMF